MIPDNFSALAEQWSGVCTSGGKGRQGRRRCTSVRRTPFGMNPSEERFKGFSGSRCRRRSAAWRVGTGFIIDKNGHIITNNHAWKTR